MKTCEQIEKELVDGLHEIDRRLRWDYAKLTALAVVFILAWAWATGESKKDSCTKYGEMTGREVQFVSSTCYVRTGDHFVPRSEYGRQP